MTFKFIDTSSNGLVVDWLDVNAACLTHHSCMLSGLPSKDKSDAQNKQNKREHHLFDDLTSISRLGCLFFLDSRIPLEY